MFIELLIVLGVMGILTTIVLVAINPQKHLCEASNARLHISARELANAVNQYEISTHKKAAGDTVPVGEMNAKPICRTAITTDDTCINLDLLVPIHLIRLPQDDNEPNLHYTGFSLYRLAAGMDLVRADHIQNCAE